MLAIGLCVIGQTNILAYYAFFLLFVFMVSGRVCVVESNQTTNKRDEHTHTRPHSDLPGLSDRSSRGVTPTPFFHRRDRPTGYSQSVPLFHRRGRPTSYSQSVPLFHRRD